jgi:GAF domain-containing protein
VVLRDAPVDALFGWDEYVAMRRPRSVLCVPMALKDKARGLVYLENDRHAGAFTLDRLRLVHILAGQLMNSIENALLAGRLRRANRDLHAKNKQLQEVDTMKDAFLAVASHELRTPLNHRDGVSDGGHGDEQAAVRVSGRHRGIVGDPAGARE